MPRLYLSPKCYSSRSVLALLVLSILLQQSFSSSDDNVGDICSIASPCPPSLSCYSYSQDSDAVLATCSKEDVRDDVEYCICLPPIKGLSYTPCSSSATCKKNEQCARESSEGGRDEQSYCFPCSVSKVRLVDKKDESCQNSEQEATGNSNPVSAPVGDSKAEEGDDDDDTSNQTPGSTPVGPGAEDAVPAPTTEVNLDAPASSPDIDDDEDDGVTSNEVPDSTVEEENSVDGNGISEEDGGGNDSENSEEGSGSSRPSDSPNPNPPSNPFDPSTSNTANPDEEPSDVCIDAGALSHLPPRALLFASHRQARVLCDARGSCATAGHMVQFHGEVMMMRSYCAREAVQCTWHITVVNSPRFASRLRIGSKTTGLLYTVFAARYESRTEERFLSTLVHLGL